MALQVNSNYSSLPVTMGNGSRISMDVRPGEVFFDENGYVWLFSMEFDDGEVGNFILRRKNTSKNQVLEFVKKHIIPLGLEISGSAIKEKNKNHPNLPAINLAVYLGQKFGPSVLNQIVDEIEDPPAWGYYEVGSGEYVITHAVRVQSW
jgi:hypothetical protein